MKAVHFILVGYLIVYMSACSPDNSNSVASQPENGTTHHGHSHAANTKSDDHSKMYHSKMESSPGAKEAPYDLQWIDTMIAHHEGAIAMAAPAYKNAKTLEITQFAEQMQRDQQKEIATMKQWRIQRFPNAKPAINMEIPGMSESMKGMDMAKLKATKGVDFDLEFIRQMVPHHEGAIVMSRDVIAKSETDDLKKLAREIIKAQEAEIAQMRKWQAQWSKK